VGVEEVWAEKGMRQRQEVVDGKDGRLSVSLGIIAGSEVVRKLPEMRDFWEDCGEDCLKRSSLKISIPPQRKDLLH